MSSIARRAALLLALSACASSAPPAPLGEPIVTTATPVTTASALALPTAAPTAEATVTASASPSASAAPPVEAEPTAPVAGKKYALVVSFISPGNGTDHDAHARLQALVAKAPKKLAQASGYWGKEGEHDECFDLGELAPAERTTFVTGVKRAMAASKRVNVSESSECRSDRR